ncbi:MAG: hypothetical protein DRN49_02345 [Thaumarchaeota archaeon]|nr:MAG: hypothetical protein DRN49_02345 [Nitrososphaerota archaeon]
MDTGGKEKLSEKDHLKEVKRERGLLEKIMSYIPGYRGYKEKELRRESDRLVRMEAVSRLRAAKDSLRSSLANPSVTQKISGEDSYKLDILIYRLDRVTQRIDRAVAGYAGIFDAIKVREDKLDDILEHDLKLIESADEIKKDIEKMVSLEPGTDDWRKALEELIVKVGELDSLIDERADTLRGLD